MGTRAMLMPRLRAMRSMASNSFSDLSDERARALANGRFCGKRAFMKA